MTIEILNEKSFILDGVPVVKQYKLVKESAKTVSLVSIYDTKEALFLYVNISEIQISGIVYTDVIQLITAFQDFLPNFNRGGTAPTDLIAKEDKANKQNGLTPDGTAVKYPTVDAINALDATLLHKTGNETKIGNLAINGILSTLPATSPNQVVVKSQLDAIIQNESRVYSFHDCLANASNEAFFVTGLLSGSFAQSSNFSPNNPGVLRIISSTTANSGGAVRTGTNAMIVKGSEVFTCIINPVTFTNTTLRAGFMDTTTIATPTNGIYFEYSGSGVLTLKTANNGVMTTSATITTLLVSTWYKLRITVNSNATSVLAEVFNSSGVLILSVTQTANIPNNTIVLNTGTIVSNSGTVATFLLDIDFISLLQTNLIR